VRIPLQPTLLVAAGISLVVAGVYLFIGYRFLHRPGWEEHSRKAMRHFALWWAATGANILMAAAIYAVAAFGPTSFAAQLSYTVVQRLLLAASLYGLLYYLSFLLVGRVWPRTLAVAYGLYFLLSAYSVFASNPQGVHVGQWRTDLAYASSVPLWTSAANLVFILVPILGGTLAGLAVAIFNRAIEPARRRRLGFVCGALTIWWTVAVLAGQREALGYESFQLINRIVGLVAAIVVLVTYEPRAVLGWMRARFHHETAAPAGAPSAPWAPRH
jgi:hypothetical protein